MRRRQEGFLISASLHDRGNARTESAPDFSVAASSALILDSIVEKRRDCLVRVASVFKNEAGNTKKMRYVRDLGALAELLGVPPSGAAERLTKFSLGRQRHHFICP